MRYYWINNTYIGLEEAYTNYLNKRNQYVQINNTKSSTQMITHGNVSLILNVQCKM